MEKNAMEIAHNLQRISLLLRISCQQASDKAGVYISQLPLLGYVSCHPGCTQRDVAQQLQVSAPNITAMVKRMVKAGLLEKRADPQNLRSNNLFITSCGKDMLNRSIEVFDQIDHTLFAGFSQPELCQLRSFTARLVENITSQEYRGATHFSLLAMLKKMESQTDTPLPHLSQEQEGPTLD